MEITQPESVQKFIEIVGADKLKTVRYPLRSPPVYGSAEYERRAQPLDKENAKVFQAAAGQAIWLLHTAYDMAFAINKLACGMSRPTVGHQEDAVWLGRYAKGRVGKGVVLQATSHATLTFYVQSDSSLADLPDVNT